MRTTVHSHKPFARNQWVLVLAAAAYVLVNVAVFTMSARSGLVIDSITYWNMALSMHQGQFTSFVGFEPYVPETIRMWGYPGFLFVCQLLGIGQTGAKLVQLAVHFYAVWALLRLLARLPATQWRYAPAVLVVMLLPNIYSAYYAGQLLAESLCASLLVLAVCKVIGWQQQPAPWTVARYAALAVIFAALTSMRPAFVLLPIFWFGVQVLYSLTAAWKSRALGAAAKKWPWWLLVFYVLLLTPFGLWNLKEHGKFKLLPVDGIFGSNMLTSLAYFKLPEGYKFVFNPLHPNEPDLNIVLGDKIQPEFTTAAEKAAYAKQLNAQILQDATMLEATLSDKEKDTLARMRVFAVRDQPDPLLMLYPSHYSLAFDKLMVQRLKNEIAADPWFYVKTRLYIAVRNWITGIPTLAWNDCRGVGCVKVVLPFFLSLYVFALLLASMYIGLFKCKDKATWLFPLAMITYVWVTFIPFSPVSRYSFPAHTLVIFCFLSLSSAWFWQRKN